MTIRQADIIPRDRSPHAHDTLRCACGAMLSWDVDPLTGQVASRCPECGASAPVQQSATPVPRCEDCGARQAVRLSRDASCDRYCEHCCLKHADEDGHRCPRSLHREHNRRAYAAWKQRHNGSPIAGDAVRAGETGRVGA